MTKLPCRRTALCLPCAMHNDEAEGGSAKGDHSARVAAGIAKEDAIGIEKERFPFMVEAISSFPSHQLFS